MSAQCVYAYVPYGSEWEDLRIFLSLHDAMHYAVKRALKYLDAKHPWSEVRRFRIELFQARAPGSHTMKPTFQAHSFRDLNVDDVELMRGALEEPLALARFFQKVN